VHEQKALEQLGTPPQIDQFGPGSDSRTRKPNTQWNRVSHAIADRPKKIIHRAHGEIGNATTNERRCEVNTGSF
jgi:hypothetical protein